MDFMSKILLEVDTLHCNKKQNKKKLLVSKMLSNVQGKSSTPAVLKRKVDDIGALQNKKWVEEIEL